MGFSQILRVTVDSLDRKRQSKTFKIKKKPVINESQEISKTQNTDSMLKTNSEKISGSTNMPQFGPKRPGRGKLRDLILNLPEDEVN